MDRYAAVVLAGGAGRRLGGPGKPGLRVGDRSMLARVLDAVADAECRIVVAPPGYGSAPADRARAGGAAPGSEPAHAAMPPGGLARGAGEHGPGPVVRVSEQPPGGGPVAALAAGLPLVPARQVAVLAADLPFLSAAAIAGLRGALLSTVDGVVFVDDTGRRQLLCGLWWTEPLAVRLAALGDVAGRSVRDLVRSLRIAELSWPAPGPPPWYDCDTDTDLRRAREWA